VNERYRDFAIAIGLQPDGAYFQIGMKFTEVSESNLDQIRDFLTLSLLLHENYASDPASNRMLAEGNFTGWNDCRTQTLDSQPGE